MAYFTRTHGNAQQVFHIDTDDGSLSGALATSGAVNVTVDNIGAGSFDLIVSNSSGTTLDALAIIAFVVI